MKYDTEFSDRTTACYYNKEKYIIAVRGTDPKNMRDLNMDGYILFNNMEKNDNFKLTELLLLKISLKYPNHKIELTGYSLGGAICLYLLDNYDKLIQKCVVFNPGVSVIPYESHILKRYAKNNKATFIVKLGDIISNGILKFNPTNLICLNQEDKSHEELHNIDNFL